MKKLFTLLFFALFAIPLHAAEEAPISPFAGNVGNAVWTLIIFVIVVAILGKFAWGPVLSSLKQREDFIHKAVSDAQKTREELERVQQESARLLQQARVEAEGILKQSRVEADRLGTELRQKAREEAEGIVKNAHRQIEFETRKAIDEIRHEAIDLSVTIAGKLLERHISKEDNTRLIDETLAQIASSRQ